MRIGTIATITKGVGKGVGMFVVLAIFYYTLFGLAFDAGRQFEEALLELSITASILTIYVWKKLVPLTN